MSARTPGGEVVLVYSGEAYNYVELRRELRAPGSAFAHRRATPRSCCAATCAGAKGSPSA